MITQKQYKEISDKQKKRVESKYPSNKVTLGDNGLIFGFWIDTKPTQTFVPLSTKREECIRLDF